MTRKKTKVKRLNRNEVALVAEMQGKIDFYERYLLELWVMIRTRQDRAILEGAFSSVYTADIYKFIKENLNKQK